MVAKNVTLENYIDLNYEKSYGCKVKYKGKVIYITTMVQKNSLYYVMIKGGDLLEIDKITFNLFSEKLHEHMQKVFGKK